MTKRKVHSKVSMADMLIILPAEVYEEVQGILIGIGIRWKTSGSTIKSYKHRTMPTLYISNGKLDCTGEVGTTKFNAVLRKGEHRVLDLTKEVSNG